MGFRVRRSVKIAPGVRVNVGKRGVSSVSVGRRGRTTNINKRGTKHSIGIPGTGVSYSTKRRSGCGCSSAAVIVMLAVVALLTIGADSCAATPSATKAPKVATATLLAGAATVVFATADLPIAPSPNETAVAVAATVSAGLTFLEVNGAPPGGTASVVVKTFANSSCTLRYSTPSGIPSEVEGLGPATADGDGIVRWEWVIGPSTKPGQGRVDVMCGDAQGANLIGVE